MRKSELLCLLRDTGPLAGARAQHKEISKQEAKEFERLNLRVPWNLLQSLDELAACIVDKEFAKKVSISGNPVRPALSGAARKIRPIPHAEIRGCQWVCDEPKDRIFCGAPVKRGRAYCEKHHRLCHMREWMK